MGYEAIPKEMREARRWLVWGAQGRGRSKPAKKPYYVDGQPRSGQLDSAEDIARLATFEQAIATKGFAGIGFALGPDGRGGFWQGIDLDDVEAACLGDIASVLPGYIEQSPSGKGLHAIGRGRHFKNLGANGTGIEAYCEKRFFTVTGDFIRGDIRCIADFAEQVLLPRHTLAVHRDVDTQRRRAPDTQKPSNSGNSDGQAMGVLPIPDYCLPSTKGVRNRILFDLARHLKAQYPQSSARDMMPTVEAWHSASLEVIGTKSWTQTWADFSYAWEKVRCPEGEGILDLTFRSVGCDTPVPEKLKSFGYDKETFRIVEFCRLLSSRNGGQFFLGCRSLAGHFGLPVSTAANVLRMLVRDGVLEEVTKGALATPKGPLSTVYQFKGW